MGRDAHTLVRWEKLLNLVFTLNLSNAILIGAGSLKATPYFPYQKFNGDWGLNISAGF